MRRSLAAAAAVTAILLMPTAAARAADQPPPTLTSSGQGQVFLAPDQATVGISVRSGAFRATDARGKANARTNAIVGALKALGVADDQLQTSGLTLQRTSLPPSKGHKQRRVFYVSSNALTLTTPDVAKLGAFIDAATKAGADNIDGPSFGFVDPSKGRIAAQQTALADARRQADAAAASQGVKIVGIRSIDLQSAPAGPQPYASQPSGGATDKKVAPPTTVHPGRQEFDANVVVVYDIAPA